MAMHAITRVTTDGVGTVGMARWSGAAGSVLSSTSEVFSLESRDAMKSLSEKFSNVLKQKVYKTKEANHIKMQFLKYF